MGSDIEKTIESSAQLLVRQIKEWTEIIINFETRNKYEIHSLGGDRIGIIVERVGGVLDTLKRMILRSHRPLEIDIMDVDARVIFHLSRNFFFFFSDLAVADSAGQKLGRIHRRFAFVYKKYDLLDDYGQIFAHIRAPLWRPWTFPVTDKSGQNVGVISKKWQGLLREAFTDADSFVVDYGNGPWSLNQKIVILGAAISIDFDFFEENQANNG